MPKEERKNQKLWADGLREDLLMTHFTDYCRARDSGSRRDCQLVMSKILHHYHAMIPWRLPDHEEPPRPLPQYDPSVVLPEEEDILEEDATRKALYMQAKEKARH